MPDETLNEALERVQLMAAGDPTWDLSDNDQKALKALLMEIVHLRETLAQYQWRPVSQIHEDFGPCVLMDIDDPGYLMIGNNLSSDFWEGGWTHFAQVPRLTNEEAAVLKAAMPKDSETEIC